MSAERPLLTLALMASVLLAGCHGLPEGQVHPVGATVSLAGWDVHVEAVEDRIGGMTEGGNVLDWIIHARVQARNASGSGSVRVVALWDGGVDPGGDLATGGSIAHLNTVHPSGPSAGSYALPQGEVAAAVVPLAVFDEDAGVRARNVTGVRVVAGNASVDVPVPHEARGDPAPVRTPPDATPAGEPFRVGGVVVTVQSVAWLPPEDPDHWQAWATKPGLRLRFDVQWAGEGVEEAPVPVWRFTDGLGKWWEPRERDWPGAEEMAQGSPREVDVTVRPGLDPHPESGGLWAYVAAGPSDPGVAVEVPPAPPKLR